MTRIRGHKAIYGNVAITRIYCDSCHQTTLVIKGKKACCGNSYEDEPGRFRRMSLPPIGRKLPGVHEKARILEEQEGRCMYCTLALGSIIYRNGKPVKLKLNWDHVDPYVYSLNNNSSNFVAACHVCNKIKYCMIFRSLDEARIFIQERRKEKGYSDMPNLQEEV